MSASGLARCTWIPRSSDASSGAAKIERVLTDNGSADRSKLFNNTCQALGIKHTFTRPRPTARLSASSRLVSESGTTCEAMTAARAARSGHGVKDGSVLPIPFIAPTHLEAKGRPACQAAMAIRTTRRFCARPASELLSAMGFSRPGPPIGVSLPSRLIQLQKR